MCLQSSLVANTSHGMTHHGKNLKRQVERLGLTQKVAAQKMGYATHQAFAALYQKEEFNEMQIEKLTKTLGFSREIFFTKPTEEYNFAGSESLCWQQLVAAQAKIIQLQEQIIAMSQPNMNAPKSTHQPA